MQTINAGGNGSAPASLADALISRLKRTDFAFTLSRLTPYPDVERELDQLDGGERQLNEDLPANFGSLGAACKAYWREHGLRPRNMPLPTASTPGEKLGQRRMLLDDVCHVLLGLSRDWPSRLSLFSYLAAQRYCPEFEWSARSAAQLFMTAAPWLRDDFAYAESYGRRLGLMTPRLLTTPIEQDWNTPLVLLRDRLNIRRARVLRRPFEEGSELDAVK